MPRKEKLVDDMSRYADTESEIQLEKVIKESSYPKKPKREHSTKRRFDPHKDPDNSLMEELFYEIQSGHNPLVDYPELEEWRYYSNPYGNDFEFYRNKAKFIFKNQLAYREFLEAYRLNEKVRKIEKLSIDEFRAILDDIRFLDRVTEELSPWYCYMFMLYTCGISYTEMAARLGREKGYKGSLERKVNKGIDVFAELLMERDMKITRGEEIAKKVMMFLKVEFEDDPKLYLEYIGHLADKMEEMYYNMRKDKK